VTAKRKQAFGKAFIIKDRRPGGGGGGRREDGCDDNEA
jgi:hypothetical protein